MRHSFLCLIVAGAFASLVAVSGCSKKTETTSTDSTSMASDTARTTTDTSHTTATTATDPAQMNLTDANIFALLSEADSGEVAEAKAVLAKAKTPDVRGFANLMITDHSRLKKEGDALAKKLNVTPQPPANDPNPGQLTQMLSQINSASDEHQLDTLYINSAVSDHEHDLTELNAYESKAQNQELKDAIKKAIPVVQKHLDRAKAIQSKMSGTTAMNGSMTSDTTTGHHRHAKK